MLGIDTAKTWLKNKKDADSKTRMALDDLISSAKMSAVSQTHFLNPQPWYTTAGKGQVIGLTDQVVSAVDIYEMCERDTYVSGLLDQFFSSLTKKGWRFGGSKGLANLYTNKMREIQLDTLISQMTSATWADGGGNFITYPVKTDSGWDVRVDPFISSGQPRVAIFADDEIRKVNKYEVLDTFTRRPIHALDVDQDYVYHGRYSDRGDFRFSSNPAKKAVFWYILKKTIAGMQLSSYQNGMQEPVIISLDYQGLAQLAQAFSQGDNKVSSSSGSTMSQEFVNDPFAFFKTQSEITRQIISDELVGPQNANKAIMTKVPVTVTKIGRDNKSMETIPLLDLCNQEMGYAMRISRGVIDTQKSKYSNSETETDNFQSLVLEPEQRKHAEWVMNWLMPIYFPKYNRDSNPFIFGVDPDDEDIKIFNSLTLRTKSQSEIIKTLLGTGYELDLESNQVIKVSDPLSISTEVIPATKPKTTEIDTNTGAKSGDIVDDTTLRSFLDDAVDSKDTQKFEKLIQKSTESQLDYYTKNLQKRDSLDDAIKHISTDFPALTSSGMPVNTLKNQLIKLSKPGVVEFRATDTKRSYARAEDDTYEYPKELSEIFDTKSQLLLKGWASLSEAQVEVMNRFWIKIKKDKKGKIIDREYQPYDGYKGLDEELSMQINTILTRNLQAGLGIEEAINDIQLIMPNIAEYRAMRIAKTESAQAIEVARYKLYSDAEYNWKQRVTVGDDRVRDIHSADASEGWIPTEDSFSHSGEKSPHEAINCRCNLRYARGEERPTD
jgi:hypothetical protein